MLPYLATDLVDSSAAAKVVAILKASPRGTEKVASVASVTGPDPRHWHRGGFNCNPVAQVVAICRLYEGGWVVRQAKRGARRCGTSGRIWA